MDESQNESSREQSPRWVPYTPPPVDGWDRLWLTVRRYSFPVVLVLCLGGLGGALYWSTEMGGTGAPPERLGSAPVLPTEVESEEPSAGSAQAPLTVRSTPEGAAVRVNGDSVGTTPLVDRPFATGVYLFSIEAPGHFRTDTVVVLQDSVAASLRFFLRPRPGTETTEDPAPEPSPSPAAAARPPPVASVPQAERTAPAPGPVQGVLFVTSTPLGAAVTVGGRERGRTPVSLSPLAVGETQVTVRLDGYVPWSQTVAVQADSVGRVHAALQPQTGRLRVLAQPWGTIYVDGTLHVRESDVWYETSLPTGRHRVTVVHPVLGQHVRDVDVPAGEDVSLVVDLQASPEGGAGP